MAELTKMTFRVHTKLWQSFDAQMDTLPIKRDPFLSGVMKREVPRLAEAMQGKKLTGRANRWVSDQLARLDTTIVNIGIEKNVAAELKAVVKASHMVRDAFFNRLIAFLRASDFLLDFYELPRREDGRVGREYVGIEKPVSPMATLQETFRDPLWYLHMAVQELYETSLYLLQFPTPTMDGYACWMDDVGVPGTPRNRKAQRDLDDILKGLGEFELDAFRPTKE